LKAAWEAVDLIAQFNDFQRGLKPHDFHTLKLSFPDSFIVHRNEPGRVGLHSWDID